MWQQAICDAWSFFYHNEKWIQFSVDIYSVFRFLNSIDPILAFLDEPKLIRSCKVIAAHKKDNNVREGKRIVRIANPLAGSPSYRENTESQKKLDSACPWLVPPTGIGRRSPLWEIGGRWSMWEEALKASDYLLVLPITTSPPTSQNPKLWRTCVWNKHKFPPAEICLVLTWRLEIPIP